jgi:type IV secretion system protein VirB11
MSSLAVFNKHVSPLEKYLNRTDIIELYINKEEEVIIEMKNGEWKFFKDKNITLDRIRLLTETIATMSGQLFDHHVPIFSGRLPKYNHRIQVNMGSMVESGIALAIRVGSVGVYPLETYMTEIEAETLKNMVSSGKTIMINAGCGCGKTTLLNSMLVHIPLDSRIITLEDTRELIIPHKNHVGLIKSKTSSDVAKLDYSDFINSITRLTPHRILLGEIDVNNTMVFLNLSNSGHSGGISTIHAESPIEALNRLCLNAALSGSKGTKADNLEYAKSAIDAFITLTKSIEHGQRTFKAVITKTEDI